MQSSTIKNKPLIILSLIGLLIAAVSTTGCYYDKEEILYPDTACDTTTIGYSVSVAPILSSSCNACHGGNTPSAGIKLDAYAGVKQQVDNGRLFGAITHSPSFSAMPKNAAKLSTCNIAKIRKWIEAGAPNN